MFSKILIKKNNHEFEEYLKMLNKIRLLEIIIIRHLSNMRAFGKITLVYYLWTQYFVILTD